MYLRQTLMQVFSAASGGAQTVTNLWNNFFVVTLYGNVSVTSLSQLRTNLNFAANYSGSIFDYTALPVGLLAVAGANATIDRMQLTNFGPARQTGLTVNYNRVHLCTGTGIGTIANTCFTTTERTGATNNAAYHIDSNSATCGAGFVAGSAYDTCLYRAAANVWTFNAGTSLRVPGYLCVGAACTTTPTNSNPGDTTIGGVILQDITRYAASGVGNRASTLVDRVYLDNIQGTSTSYTGLSYTYNIYNGNASDPKTLGTLISMNPVISLGGAITQTLAYGIWQRWTYLANATISFGTWRGFWNRHDVTAGGVVTFNTYTAFYDEVARANNFTATTSRRFRCQNGGIGNNTNVCFSAEEQTGASQNAAFHIDSNSATCGAGLVAGTTFDTCLYRGRAGAWTGPAGTDIYTDSGYICAGTGCSSVTSTNTGVYDAGVRVMSSVSCTGATCALTNGALSVTVPSVTTGTNTGTVSIVAGSAAGTGAIASVTGTGGAFKVSVTPGTSRGTSNQIFVVTFGTAWSSAPSVVCQPTNQYANLLSPPPWGSASTTQFQFISGPNDIGGNGLSWDCIARNA
jgi:hypothetical protein